MKDGSKYLTGGAAAGGSQGGAAVASVQYAPQDVLTKLALCKQRGKAAIAQIEKKIKDFEELLIKPACEEGWYDLINLEILESYATLREVIKFSLSVLGMLNVCGTGFYKPDIEYVIKVMKSANDKISELTGGNKNLRLHGQKTRSFYYAHKYKSNFGKEIFDPLCNKMYESFSAVRDFSRSAESKQVLSISQDETEHSFDFQGILTVFKEFKGSTEMEPSSSYVCYKSLFLQRVVYMLQYTSVCFS